MLIQQRWLIAALLAERACPPSAAVRADDHRALRTYRVLEMGRTSRMSHSFTTGGDRRDLPPYQLSGYFLKR